MITNTKDIFKNSYGNLQLYKLPYIHMYTYIHIYVYIEYIKLIITWKLHPCRLAFIVLEGSRKSKKGEK